MKFFKPKKHTSAIIKLRKPSQFSGSKRGFTLMELILYISIASSLLISTTIFISIIINANTKNTAVNEVEHQGKQIIELISQTVRQSTGINTPTQGVSASTLSLAMPSASQNPTLFDINAGAIRITEGATAPMALNNKRVIASALLFKNLSINTSFGNLRIIFTLTHINPKNRNEYNYTKTFYGTVNTY